MLQSDYFFGGGGLETFHFSSPHSSLYWVHGLRWAASVLMQFQFWFLSFSSNSLNNFSSPLFFLHKSPLCYNSHLLLRFLISLSLSLDVFCYLFEPFISRFKSTIFWDITPCSPLKVNRRFGEIYCLDLQGRRISRASTVGDMFLRNVGRLFAEYTALYPRR
jgi:hypothetical protein